MKQPVERRLAAILAADVAGSSRLMGADEEGTLERLKAHRRELVDRRSGNTAAASSRPPATACWWNSQASSMRFAEIQRAMIDRNTETPEEKRITFRIGINLGDVIIDGDDIYGDGVNIAAQLEALADLGGICISRAVQNQIRDKLPYSFDDMGEQSVKNIARPVRAYGMSADAVASTPLRATQAQPRRPSPGYNLRRALMLAMMVALVGIGSAIWWARPQRTPTAASVRDLAAAGSPVPVNTKPISPSPLSVAVLPFANLSNANPRLFFVRLWLAAPLALRDELFEAKSALSQSMKLRPEISSLARWRAEYPWYSNPQFVALAEPTLYAGLRRAGFPEE